MATLVAPDVVAAADWRQQRWRRIPTFTLPAMRWWVHHGAGGDSTLRTLLGYERYHVKTRGWAALGYSFAICYDGRKATIYVARGWGGVGAHTLGDNDESHGVVLVGDWTSGTVPTPMVHAMAWLILRGEEIDAGPREITGGHRNAPGAQTSCPGDAGIRALAAAREHLDRSEPVDPTPPPEEEDDVAVDVIETDDGEVWLLAHPLAIGPVPAAHRDYYRNLADAKVNRQYKGPWPWPRSRVDAHPQRAWAAA